MTREGLQEQQKEDGIFISQDKYVAEILKKFNYFDVKYASTPVDLEKPLVKDGDADDVDVHVYRSMIGSSMYLTTSRPDIMCTRFQVTPKTSHLLAVKRIFRYLKGKSTLGLWYSRDSPFELVAYTDSDYAEATQDRKSTTEGCQFLGNRLISWQCKKQIMVATFTTEAEYVAAASCCGQVKHIEYLKMSASPLKKCMSKEIRTPRYLSLVVPLKKVGDEAVHKELGDIMERAATTASSLEAEQDSVVPSAFGHHPIIRGDVDAQTRFEITSKQSNDPPLSRGYLLRSGEDIYAVRHMLMLLVQVLAAKVSEEVGEDSDHPTDSNQIPIVDQPSTYSQHKQKQKSKRKQRKEAEVLDLEKAKDAQAKEIVALKKRVQKLERKKT
ncbi:hypothetical protein Tco_0550941 [Tanacetum coccineum]